MDLTPKQQLFLDLASMGKNIYLSGKAGTGKSTVVKKFIDQAEKQKLKIPCLATTGVAAQNIRGQTIHSFFRIGFGKIIQPSDIKKLFKPKKELIKKVRVIVIDEVSMLRPDVLDAIFYTYEKNNLDIFKVQFIFVGDLAQLPPTITDTEQKDLYSIYGGVNFFHSNFYKNLQVENIDLDEVVRQSNNDFVENLNIIRNGGKSSYFKQFVSKEPKGIILAPHNDTVKKYNEEGLSKLEGKIIKLETLSKGKAKPSDFNLEEELNVKVGAKIMYLANDSKTGLVNGTLGEFCYHDFEEQVPDQNFQCQKHIRQAMCIKVGEKYHELEKFTFEKFEYQLNDHTNEFEKKVIGSVTCYPIKLAYALTIHKSQGLTFDEVTIDLTKPCFQKGQLYTALSRVRAPEGLRIII